MFPKSKKIIKKIEKELNKTETNKQIVYDGFLFAVFIEGTQIDLLFEDETRKTAEFYLKKGQKLKVTIELLEGKEG